jgi:AhpD family alkylhydroperoxidase
MEQRLTLSNDPMFTNVVEHLVAANAAVTGSSIPATTRLLVTLRASQINGCGPCVEMHTHEALRAGEDQERLTLVVAWREATVFTDAERAALELAEQGTRIADAAGGVDDEAWTNATKYYDDDELTALVAVIALINTFNRINVITRRPAGNARAAV